MPSKRKENKLIRSLDTVGFYSDFDKPGTLFATLVRSPSPVGKIKSITISDLPEGYYFFTEKDIPMSKYQAFNYLHISRATFDNLVREGKIPQGKKQQGFNELQWFKKDLDTYRENKFKHK